MGTTDKTAAIRQKRLRQRRMADLQHYAELMEVIKSTGQLGAEARLARILEASERKTPLADEG